MFLRTLSHTACRESDSTNLTPSTSTTGRDSSPHLHAPTHARMPHRIASCRATPRRATPRCTVPCRHAIRRYNLSRSASHTCTRHTLHTRTACTHCTSRHAPHAMHCTHAPRTRHLLHATYRMYEHTARTPHTARTAHTPHTAWDALYTTARRGMALYTTARRGMDAHAVEGL